MQNIFQQMAMSLVTGVCFTLVILIATFVLTSSEDGSVHIDQPNNIVLLEHALQPGSDRLTIQGRIKNDSGEEWSYVGLAAQIYVGPTLMNECYASVDNFKVASVREFKIACRSASGIDLPEGLRYELFFRTAKKMWGT